AAPGGFFFDQGQIFADESQFEHKKSFGNYGKKAGLLYHTHSANARTANRWLSAGPVAAPRGNKKK
ncbi:MAG: hypothetical protein FWC60_01495, partial [Firmicutes bacterium]|nr:hypothetical protein [Bacillota bacterium]